MWEFLYRCEVCGYSTTTKGNLTIHLQSDKHANNVRVLQAAGKLPKRITVMPDCHVMARNDQQDDLSRPWRCEPCGYSTNINSNLRIHLSSEKHAMAVRKLQGFFSIKNFGGKREKLSPKLKITSTIRSR